MHYDLIDLRYFVLAVDAGGIAAAARQANISVSALSERLKALEEQAGVALLTRSAKGSRPTQAGLELSAQARAVLMQAERLNGVVAAWKQKDRDGGLVRLRANSNAITSFLPEALARFLARNPEVVVDLNEDTSDEIVRAVRVGDADLGIAAGNVNMEGLETRLFRSDRLVLLVPPGHALAGAKVVDFATVLDEPFIGLDRQSAIQGYLAGQAQKLGQELVPRIRLRSFEGVCRMVAAGAGVAIVPESAVSQPVLEAGAQTVALTASWTRRDLVLCLPRDRPVSPLVRRLAADILEPEGARFEQVGRRGRAQG